MRIIGGDHRGRKLATPADKNIRPTSDRMRETIFNILSHSPVELTGANVLDVFAGTGALGLEALSRGAAHVTFFDKDRKSLSLVKKNVALLKALEKTTIKCISSPKLPPSRIRYDVVFLDPPYNLDVINETISVLEKNVYLSDDVIIVIEYSSSNELIIPDFLKVTKEKTYGESRFSFLIRNNP